MGARQTRRRFLQVTGMGAAASLAGARSYSGPVPQAPAEQQVQSSSASKTLFTLGLASYTFRKFTLAEALAMTQRLRLKYIALKSFHLPIESQPDEIAAAAAKVKEAGITLYGGGVIYMKDAPAVHQAFDYAKAAGMKMIIGVPSYELLELVNQKVQEYHIKVAIHNHGPGDRVYPTPGIAYEKIKTLDARIGLCIDVGHTQRAGVDPAEAAQRYADRLLDVHMKDVSAAAPEGRTVEIGRGVIDIPKFLRTLLKTGYSGIVSFEYEKDAKDPLPGVAESVGYVRGVLASV